MALILAGCGDNDDETQSALLSVFPEQPLVLFENGESADFTIKLNAQPESPINIDFIAEPGLSLSSPYLTITPADWHVARSLSVNCPDDDVAADRTIKLTFRASGLDEQFNGITLERTVACLDDGNNEEDEYKLCENGEILCINETNYLVCDVANNSWNPTVLTCPEQTPVCDGSIDPNACVVKKECTGPDCIIPTDVADFIHIDASSNVTSEDGQTATLAISLGKRPTENVVVLLTSSDETEATVQPSKLLFAPRSWFKPQTVTVTGVPDIEQDGDVPYRIQVKFLGKDSRFSSLAPFDIQMTNLDAAVPLNGTPGVFVTPVSGLKTSEKGGESSFSVILTGTPTADVRIPVKSSDESEGKPSVSELVFTPANWNLAQSVKITGVDDDESDGDVTYQIKLGPAVSADTRYDAMPVTSVSVTNEDNDAPDIPVSFTVSATSLTIEESGKSASFTIVPTAQPIGDVAISLAVSDNTEATVSPNNIVFSPNLWNIPQTVKVRGLVDNIEDGDQTFKINFDVTSDDARYDDYEIAPISVVCKDSDAHTGNEVKLRVMAANITSGNGSGYSERHGVRIFQAVKPDIVLIQEFNWFAKNDTDDVAKKLVDEAFGSDYTYTRGRGSIPNGVISRYPIIDSGYWPSNQMHDRDWDWAVVDLPGPKELLVVSVHLSTKKNGSEMPVLIEAIQSKIKADAKEGKSYFVMIGGDFNTSNRNSTIQYMSELFTTKAPYPVDQKDNPNTNSNRSKPYDYLMCSPDWCKYEIPVEIGTHTGEKAYKNGHVFDSRVYAQTPAGNATEINYVSPVQAGDSDADQMQHMPVIRDFLYSY